MMPSTESPYIIFQVDLTFIPDIDIDIVIEPSCKPDSISVDDADNADDADNIDDTDNIDDYDNVHDVDNAEDPDYVD